MNLPAFLDVTRAFQFFIWQMISFGLIYNQDNERFQILGWKPRQLFGWNWWLWNEYIMFHSVSPNLHITAYQWHGDWGLPQEHEQFGTNIPSGFLLRPHHQSIRKWLLSFCYFPSSIFFIITNSWAFILGEISKRTVLFAATFCKRHYIC